MSLLLIEKLPHDVVVSCSVIQALDDSIEGVSNMSKKIYVVVTIILLSLIACGQVKQEEIKTEDPKLNEIKTRAEESMNAFVSGDYQKVTDLTYPKVVEMMGGKEKMISAVEQQMKAMKAQGVELNSVSVGVPKEVVEADSQLFAIVPYALKLKTPKGVLNQQSYLLAISNKDNVKWTFIDVTDLDEGQLKTVVPGVIGKLTFPKKQPPVLE
jgi:type III secretory pathway component EscV